MARPTLPEHRKFKRLARALGSKALAWGSLEMIWNGCYQSGDDYLGDADDVETAAEWPPERRGELVAALLDAGGGHGAPGFIHPCDRVSGGYHVHDLRDHEPDYVVKRRKREDDRRAKSSQCPVSDQSESGQRLPCGCTRTRALARALALAQECPPPARVDAPAHVSAREWRKGLSDRWRDKSSAKGFSFPMLDDLADECEAAAKQLSMQPLDVFDRVVAEFLKYRTECSTGRAPNLVPAKVVQHFATLVERMTGAAPKGPALATTRRRIIGPAEPSDFSDCPAEGRDALADWKG